MTDVVVIGDGAAGLAAALPMARMNLDVMVIGNNAQRNAMATEMHAYLGHDGTAPKEFYSSSLDQLVRYENVSATVGSVTSVDGSNDSFQVHLGARSIPARRVLIATGAADSPPSIEGMAELWGHGVHHCPVCHGWEQRGKPVAVVAPGPADLPVGLAMRLTWICRPVTLFTNSDQPLEARTAAAVGALGIGVVYGNVLSIEGDRSTQVIHTAQGDYKANAVFTRAASRPRSAVAAAIGCRILPSGHVEVDSSWRSSIDGVFAAGEVAKSLHGNSAGSNLIAAAAAGHHAGLSIFEDLWDSDVQRRIREFGSHLGHD
ncbi:NAD(P)/FAD-dependent oxidoreductase [Kribbella sp. NPDC056345]|uniref:NAD(P)/FAD-dependent oxidoreductase n=1 Tax=Kribbella sp. NPDC056345 TaxID=3345789 RepID=UPI0035E2387F